MNNNLKVAISFHNLYNLGYNPGWSYVEKINVKEQPLALGFHACLAVDPKENSRYSLKNLDSYAFNPWNFIISNIMSSLTKIF
jgi:hypothetical protein